MPLNNTYCDCLFLGPGSYNLQNSAQTTRPKCGMDDYISCLCLRAGLENVSGTWPFYQDSENQPRWRIPSLPQSPSHPSSGTPNPTPQHHQWLKVYLNMGKGVPRLKAHTAVVFVALGKAWWESWLWFLLWEPSGHHAVPSFRFAFSVAEFWTISFPLLFPSALQQDMVQCV